MVVCQGKPSRCPSPPVGEGTYYSGSRDVGSTVSFHCPVGQMPTGETEAVCLESGEWSSEEPVGCKAVDCGQVPGLANGEIHVLDGRTTWGARVKYVCKENYALMKGSDTRQCDEGGWSGDAPECVYTKCPEPEEVENSEMKHIGDKRYFLGSKVVYTCKEGHVASGSLSRECAEGGRWSGSPPKCSFLDCGDPPALDHGKHVLLDGRTSFNAEAEYTCDEDYIISSRDAANKRRCETNGRWSKTNLRCSIIECPVPRAPTGGRVSGYDRTIRAEIEFSCLTGHVLEGNEVLACTRDGRWSGVFPTCRFVDCGPLPQLPGGAVSYVNGSTHLGSMARYSCHRSHAMVAGDVERVCMGTGKWSGLGPECSEIRCKLPPRPNNTIISVSRSVWSTVEPLIVLFEYYL